MCPDCPAGYRAAPTGHRLSTEPAVGYRLRVAQTVTAILQTGAFVSKPGEGVNEELCVLFR